MDSKIVIIMIMSEIDHAVTLLPVQLLHCNFIQMQGCSALWAQSKSLEKAAVIVNVFINLQLTQDQDQVAQRSQ